MLIFFDADPDPGSGMKKFGPGYAFRIRYTAGTGTVSRFRRKMLHRNLNNLFYKKQQRKV
jgi:hypothetical protein